MATFFFCFSNVNLSTVPPTEDYQNLTKQIRTSCVVTNVSQTEAPAFAVCNFTIHVKVKGRTCDRVCEDARGECVGVWRDHVLFVRLSVGVERGPGEKQL